jgi:hypothetical protein
VAWADDIPKRKSSGPSPLTGDRQQPRNIVLEYPGVKRFEHQRVETKLPRFLHHIITHLACNQNVFGGRKLGAKFLEKRDPVFARQAVIDDEDADSGKMGSGLEGLLGTLKSLDDVLLAQKGIQSASDIGIIFDHNDALISDLPAHALQNIAEAHYRKQNIGRWPNEVSRSASLVSVTRKHKSADAASFHPQI